MGTLTRWFGVAGVSLSLFACGAPDASDGVVNPTGQVREALNACDETVPADRYIDGFPAYAQCPAIENGAIYSNNGIDTSATASGADWIRTQYSGGYQCTELAHRYLHFKWGVDWLPRGNAGEWCDTQPTATSGVVQTTTPVHGDIMVLAPGSCGASAQTGHVAVVDSVNAATGKISAVQQNRASRGSYALTCAKCYLHVVANDGENTSSGAGGAASGSGGAGSTVPPASTGGAPMGLPSTGGVAGAAPVQGGSGGATGSGGTPSGPPVASGGTAGSMALPGVPSSSPGVGGQGQPLSASESSPANDDGATSCRVGRGFAARDRPSALWLALALGALHTARRRRISP